VKQISEYLPLIGMAGFIVIVQVLALTMAGPMEEEGMQALENPASLWNPVYYIILILVFTIFILYVIKTDKKYILHAILLFAVAATLYYVFVVFIGAVPAILLTTAITILLYKFPEWYIVDITGILVGAGASAIIGISLAILPTLILLILLTIYDIISVYKTKHMITLAEGVMDIHAPILFVVPKRRDYSFVKQDFSEGGGERGAYFMGLGDAVMPTILVVSASVFLPVGCMAVQLPLLGGVALPVVLAAIGTLIGYTVLMIVVMGGKPQAGLPFLNTGAILGYVAGCVVAGIPILPLAITAGV
jgi:presenilin-like A22 family membrane protease